MAKDRNSKNNNNSPTTITSNHLQEKPAHMGWLSSYYLSIHITCIIHQIIPANPKSHKLLWRLWIISIIVLISYGILEVNILTSTRINVRNFMNRNVLKIDDKIWQNTGLPRITTGVKYPLPRNNPCIEGTNKWSRTLFGGDLFQYSCFWGTVTWKDTCSKFKHTFPCWWIWSLKVTYLSIKGILKHMR